jgi:hypothetical protein
MAEPRFERELRTMLAHDLESIHGPHDRWIDAPVARRIERSSGLAGRWPALAILAVLAAASLAILGLVAVLGSRPPEVPAPTPTATLSARSVGCPTLADYRAQIAAPSAQPAAPSFTPVAPDAKPTVGVLTPGQVGVVAAPDGSPGALFRVSNPRFCDRLPDQRLEDFGLSTLPGDYRLLLVDVEFTVLRAGSIDSVIPGSIPVFAKSRDEIAVSFPTPYDIPGSDMRTRLQPPAGFAYRGVMSWIVEPPERGGRIAVEVGAEDAVAFEYLIQDGSTEHAAFRPVQTTVPGSTPSTGVLAPGASATVSADGALMPVYVGGVDVVDGYPRVMPSREGDRFIEVFARFGMPSAPYTIDAGDWVLVGPDGHDIPRLTDPGTSDAPLLPPYARPWSATEKVGPARQITPLLYVVAEVPPTGRITLEYRPHGGPAQVTWVVRDR